MALPDAVKEADRLADEAAAAYDEELKEDTDNGSTLDDVLEPDDADQTDVDDDVDAADDGDADDADPGDDDGTGDDEDEDEPAEDVVDASKWEQKYRTLLGKYNAEVPRLIRDLDYLRGQVSALAAAKGAVKTDGADEAEDSGDGEDPKGFAKYLKKDEMDQYDADILDFQSRVAKGSAESAMMPLINKLQARIQQLEGSEVERAGASFWDVVDANYPGGKEINDTDPLWPDYLDQVDPVSGKRLRDLGEAAIASGDVGRIVSLLTGFAGEPAGDDDDGGAADDASPAADEGKAKARPPVKPTRAKGGTVRTTPKNKPMIKSSEIELFFTDVARGKYAGREKDMKAREALIESAVLEDRVTPG